MLNTSLTNHRSGRSSEVFRLCHVPSLESSSTLVLDGPRLRQVYLAVCLCCFIQQVFCRRGILGSGLCFVKDASSGSEVFGSSFLQGLPTGQLFGIFRLPTTTHPPRDNLPEREREQHSTHHATIIQSFEIFIATKQQLTYLLRIATTFTSI